MESCRVAVFAAESVTCTANAEVAGKLQLHPGVPEISPVVEFRTKLKGSVLPGEMLHVYFPVPPTAWRVPL